MRSKMILDFTLLIFFAFALPQNGYANPIIFPLPRWDWGIAIILLILTPLIEYGIVFISLVILTNLKAIDASITKNHVLQKLFVPLTLANIVTYVFIQTFVYFQVQSTLCYWLEFMPIVVESWVLWKSLNKSYRLGLLHKRVPWSVLVTIIIAANLVSFIIGAALLRITDPVMEVEPVWL